MKRWSYCTPERENLSIGAGLAIRAAKPFVYCRSGEECSASPFSPVLAGSRMGCEHFGRASDHRLEWQITAIARGKHHGADPPALSSCATTRSTACRMHGQQLQSNISAGDHPCLPLCPCFRTCVSLAFIKCCSYLPLARNELLYHVPYPPDTHPSVALFCAHTRLPSPADPLHHRLNTKNHRPGSACTRFSPPPQTRLPRSPSRCSTGPWPLRR